MDSKEQLQEKIEQLQKKIEHLTTVSGTLDQIEPFYRMLADSVPGIVYRVLARKNNQTIFYNDHLQELTGYKSGELAGGEVCQLDFLVVKEDRDRVLAEVRQAVREKRRFELEYAILRKDGGRRIVSERGHPIIGKDECLLYIDGVILDITDKRQTQDILRQTLRFSDAVISHIEEGIVVYDRQLRYKVWNRFMERLTGLSEESVLGKNTLDLFPQLKKYGIDRLILRAFEGKVVSSQPFKYAAKEPGRSGWVENTYMPYRDHDGKIVAVIGVIHEVTKRMTDALALKESKEYLEQIIDAMADPLFVKDDRHRFVLVNGAFCRILGRSRQEILGKQDGDFFPSGQVEAFLRKDREVLEKGTPNLSEESLTDAGGLARIIVTKTTLYRDSAGNRFIVGTIRDVSEQKQMEFKLRQKMEDLEQMNRFMVDRELKMIELKEAIAGMRGPAEPPKPPPQKEDPS